MGKAAHLRGAGGSTEPLRRTSWPIRPPAGRSPDAIVERRHFRRLAASTGMTAARFVRGGLAPQQSILKAARLFSMSLRTQPCRPLGSQTALAAVGELAAVPGHPCRTSSGAGHRCRGGSAPNPGSAGQAEGVRPARSLPLDRRLRLGRPGRSRKHLARHERIGSRTPPAPGARLRSASGPIQSRRAAFGSRRSASRSAMRFSVKPTCHSCAHSRNRMLPAWDRDRGWLVAGRAEAARRRHYPAGDRKAS